MLVLQIIGILLILAIGGVVIYATYAALCSGLRKPGPK
jgi:hypothetical protein